jgi:hypothetical protein
MKYIIGVAVVLGLTMATTVGSDFYVLLTEIGAWDACVGNC